VVALLRPLARQHLTGAARSAFDVTNRLLGVLAAAAAAGTLLLGVNYYFLDGAPTIFPQAGLAYGGAINSGLFLALASLVLLVGQLGLARMRAGQPAVDATSEERVPTLAGVRESSLD
jgi:hypothetical protein